MQKVYTVGVATSSTVIYWLFWLLLIVISMGLALIIFPISLIYRLRVTNRTRLVYDENSNRVRYTRGRLFTLDDDVIPVRSIDNVKIDRTVLGSLFGWCNLEIYTRAEKYRLTQVSKQDAEAFREAFLETV